jgi:hypothetical protein
MPVPACPTCSNPHDPAIECRLEARQSMAEFRLSVMLADIEEADAKLETLRTQETEVRAILVAALGTLAYRAEEAKFRFETGQWADLRNHNEDLAKAALTVGNAQAAHAAILDYIATAEDEKTAAEVVFNAMKAGA